MKITKKCVLCNTEFHPAFGGQIYCGSAKKEKIGCSYLMKKEKHKISSRKRMKRYREKHRELWKKNAKIYRNSIKGKYSYYKRSAKRRGKEFALSLEDISKFWQKPCYYCGTEIKTIGLDRINNLIGYKKNNLVSCCRNCNRAKMTLSKENFIKICKIIAGRF